MLGQECERSALSKPKSWEFKLQETLQRIGIECAKSSECNDPHHKVVRTEFLKIRYYITKLYLSIPLLSL